MNTHIDDKPVHKKKWLALTAVGIALLLIPRRSSRKASSQQACGHQSEQVNSHASNDNKDENISQ
ncbi:MAG: hypothetical protein L0G25_00025 [Psychrobacter sp.]|nr:hypothetical protein [Psychrobacter sp.]